jgi:hypothetical protein
VLGSVVPFPKSELSFLVLLARVRLSDDARDSEQKRKRDGNELRLEVPRLHHLRRSRLPVPAFFSNAVSNTLLHRLAIILQSGLVQAMKFQFGAQQCSKTLVDNVLAVKNGGRPYGTRGLQTLVRCVRANALECRSE